MPILTLQRRQTEVGRIRLGTSEEATSKRGATFQRPVKLDTFRFTSPSKTLIEQVAQAYGGEPKLWQPQGGGAPQWEVVTGVNAVPVVVPPNSVSQWMEHWNAGVCERRCDGVREVLKDRDCVCSPDPAERECKATTRIAVMLADIPGIGVWRLESHGFYAATELPAVAELLAAAGGYVPARLEAEERTVRRAKPGGGTELRRWMTPVLHVDAAPAQLLALTDGAPAAAAIEAAPERAALPAAPEPQPAAEAQPGVDWYARVAACQTLPELRALWEELRGAKVNDLALNRAWWARKADIDKAAREPDGTPAATPAEQEPDRDAVWGEILRLGAERGWNTSTVSRLMTETVGHDPANADGWTFVQFRDAIKNGQVTA